MATASDAAKLQKFFDDNKIEITGLKGKLTDKDLKAFSVNISYTYNGRKIDFPAPTFTRVDDTTFEVASEWKIGDTTFVRRVWELKCSNGQITLTTRTNDFYKKNQNPPANFEGRYVKIPVKLIREAYKWAK